MSNALNLRATIETISKSIYFCNDLACSKTLADEANPQIFKNYFDISQMITVI